MTRAQPSRRVVDDFEESRHLLDRVEFFLELAETLDGPNEDEHRLALVEVASTALQEALALFDSARRALVHPTPVDPSTALARTQKRP